MSKLREEDIIEGCKRNKKKAQLEFYKKYSPVLRAVAYRYMDDKDIADDLVHDAVINIFEKIKQYKGEGSFEGWIKRIMINTILMYYRKQKISQPIDENYIQGSDDSEAEGNLYEKISAEISQQEIFELISKLPEGYKMLNISESTSKTQLMRARKMLKQKLMELMRTKKIEL